MYLKPITACIWVVMLAAFMACQPKHNTIATDFSANSTKIFENYLLKFKEIYRLPSVEIAIVSKDSLFTTATGIKNVNKDPISSSSIIAGGAFSEPVLASVVLKMANQGLLSLDDPIVKYLPYFRMGSEEYKNITIKDLLTHTSGIDSYGISYGESSFDDNAPEITTRSISNQQLKWQGSERRVSRSVYNYDILADLVSKVSKMPFEYYVSKELFIPLKMNSSYFYKVKNATQPFVVSNYLTYHFKPASIYPYNRENGGSGGLHTTADDMAIWMQYVLNNEKLHFFDIPVKTSTTNGIGYGWEIYYKNAIPIYVKETRMNGFSNKMILIPSKKIGLCVMVNLDNDLNCLSQLDGLLSFLDGDNAKASELKIPIHLPMGDIIAKNGGHVQKAILFYEEAYRLYKEKYDFKIAYLEQLGINLVHKVGDFQKAIDYYKFCLQKHPVSSGIYLNLAEAYVLDKQIAKAEEAIREALKYPDDTGFRDSFLAYLREKIEVIREKKQNFSTN
ncbi:beta-lactamase [Pseudopedobacter saltans DSM 12145]|uniref:Beta-lactamase n=1 Tax=Pseudopedobacter saltans (strain ATCC 51119 / DSM 12145 / JCM 21818 / CCUG 39354 / LMG 10337 / NBRC 100064 / NCIMB 13643) TaxID=762903 RepID=F0S5B2_PSESL|nr:serine hydrolase [Pseudopedobacter saltans]ADY52057.1 beta-lactamase [Pseudopedobacter saltans DSM 12145]